MKNASINFKGDTPHVSSAHLRDSQDIANSQVSRTIRCTEHNAKQFQRIVKNEPALLNLVQSLQAQNLFPGLRAMTITITGSPETVAQGLDAWPAA